MLFVSIELEKGRSLETNGEHVKNQAIALRTYNLKVCFTEKMKFIEIGIRKWDFYHYYVLSLLFENRDFSIAFVKNVMTHNPVYSF